jgi:hypothetical protein
MALSNVIARSASDEAIPDPHQDCFTLFAMTRKEWDCHAGACPEYHEILRCPFATLRALAQNDKREGQNDNKRRGSQ